MSLTKAEIKNLDTKKNISVDSEKTKERFKVDFSATSKSQKDEIAELSGHTTNSQYRVAKTGSIGIATVIATAQVLNISPFWYTGETDTKDELSDELLNDFLSQHGAAVKQKRKYTKKNKSVSEVVKTSESAEIIVADSVTETDIVVANDNETILKFEDAAKLLEALYIGARFSADVAEKLAQVKKSLV